MVKLILVFLLVCVISILVLALWSIYGILTLPETKDEENFYKEDEDFMFYDNDSFDYDDEPEEYEDEWA